MAHYANTGSRCWSCSTPSWSGSWSGASFARPWSVA